MEKSNESQESQKEIAEHLQAALDLLGENGEGWGKGWFAYDEKGRRVMEHDEKAVKWCMGGALLKTSVGEIGAWRALWSALNEIPWSPESVERPGALEFILWQDDPDRKFTEVKSLFERAILSCSPSE